VTPDSKKCPDCRLGYSPAYFLIERGMNEMMYQDGIAGDPYATKITKFLCGRSPRGTVFGHDAMDIHNATKKLGELAGLSDGWWRCKTCNGEGEIPNV
jgi:hypothetical protein